MQLQEVIRLIREREVEFLPTAPIHGSSSEVGGIVQPKLYVGWEISLGNKLSNELVDGYVKTFRGKESNLSKYVRDVPKFMEAVWRELNRSADVPTDRDEIIDYLQRGDEDSDEMVDERNLDIFYVSDVLLWAEAICLKIYLQRYKLPIQILRDETYPSSCDERYTNHPKTFIVGKAVKRCEIAKELVEEILKLKEEMEKKRERIPKAVKVGKVEAFIDGDENCGTVYDDG
jgi:hypothetical protein